MRDERAVSAPAAVAVLSVVLCFLALTVACSGEKQQQRPVNTGVGTPSAAAESVRIDSGNGAVLTGRLYGRRAVNGVVLVPDTGARPEVWEPYAGELAATGVLVLALDLSSGGTPDADALRAAMNELHARGADKVALMGEGAGGIAALTAGDGVRGVAVLSAPTAALGSGGSGDGLVSAGRAGYPVLFMASLADADSAQAAGRLYDASHDPRTRALVPGAGRGTEILRGGSAAEAKQVLNDFLQGVFKPLTA